MKKIFITFLAAASCVLGPSCSKPPPATAADEKPQLHKDVPPHGGTPVALGDDYNIEFVHEAGSNLLTGYVLDDEMEDFIRSSSRTVSIKANVGGEIRTLELRAVANPATGETEGDTSQFEGSADWLISAPKFDGILVSITIRGTTFTDIKFSFPKNEGP